MLASAHDEVLERADRGLLLLHDGADHVADRDDADQPFLVHDRQVPDVTLGHDGHALVAGPFRGHADDALRSSRRRRRYRATPCRAAPSFSRSRARTGCPPARRPSSPARRRCCVRPSPAGRRARCRLGSRCGPQTCRPASVARESSWLLLAVRRYEDAPVSAHGAHVAAAAPAAAATTSRQPNSLGGSGAGSCFCWLRAHYARAPRPSSEPPWHVTRSSTMPRPALHSEF